MPLPVHRLACAEDYLAVLDGYAQVFPPGEQFAYCNGGFVVLAIVAERAAGQPYHDLVHERVCQPAGLVDTAFLRNDESHERVAQRCAPATPPLIGGCHQRVRSSFARLGLPRVR